MSSRHLSVEGKVLDVSLVQMVDASVYRATLKAVMDDLVEQAEEANARLTPNVRVSLFIHATAECVDEANTV